MPSISTYIGIAFFAVERHPYQSAIFLSAHMQFDDALLKGTVINGVNGLKVIWMTCDNSPAISDPYLRPVGVIMVAKVDYQPNDVLRSIHSLVWKPEDVRVNSDTLKDAYSYDFVCRAVLDLCNKRIISLSSDMKNNLDGHITDCLGKLMMNQGFRFPIISLEDGNSVFGRTMY
jgi:hypothetical protein